MMYEITRNLFLSGYHDVPTDMDAFVVNCTKDLPFYSSRGVRLAVDDDGSNVAMNEMFLHMTSGVLDHIHEELQNDGVVIVHCLAGQQRSPAIVAAYLMTHAGLTLEQAVRHIRAKKPDAFFWSINFLDSLQRYEMMLRS